jgi:hypothetical protein
MDQCVHNVIRRKRPEDGQYTFEPYVCGSCGTIFEVKVHVEPEPPQPTPMFDRRPPWGLRDRQA